MTTRTGHDSGTTPLSILTYPFHGATLAALVGMTLAHFVISLLPSVLAFFLLIFLWIGLFMYATACLQHSANGFSDAPEIVLDVDRGVGTGLLLLQLLGVALLLLAITVLPLAWLGVLVLLVLAPAIAMSLAAGDSFFAALNPATMLEAMLAFGAAYVIPIISGIMYALGLWLYLRTAGMHHLAWFAATVALLLIHFHIMGVLIYRFRDRIGHVAVYDALVQDRGGNADDDLLAQCQHLIASKQEDHARSLLQSRINERSAADEIHRAYHELLRTQADQPALLAHARIWLATMMADHQSSHALALLREVIELDPGFLPDDPDVVAELADVANARGMTQLAIKLARAYPNHWPREPDAARFGLLAARLMAQRMQQPNEAAVLASKLLIAYPNCAQRDEIEALLADLKAGPQPGAWAVETFEAKK